MILHWEVRRVLASYHLDLPVIFITSVKHQERIWLSKEVFLVELFAIKLECNNILKEDHTGLSKVAGCRRKSPPTCLESASYSVGISLWMAFLNKYPWTGCLLWQLSHLLQNFWQPWPQMFIKFEPTFHFIIWEKEVLWKPVRRNAWLHYTSHTGLLQTRFKTCKDIELLLTHSCICLMQGKFWSAHKIPSHFNNMRYHAC